MRGREFRASQGVVVRDGLELRRGELWNLPGVQPVEILGDDLFNLGNREVGNLRESRRHRRVERVNPYRTDFECLDLCGQQGGAIFDWPQVERTAPRDGLDLRGGEQRD